MDVNDELQARQHRMEQTKLREANLIEADKDKAKIAAMSMIVIRCQEERDHVELRPLKVRDTNKRWTIRDLRKVA